MILIARLGYSKFSSTLVAATGAFCAALHFEGEGLGKTSCATPYAVAKTLNRTWAGGVSRKGDYVSGAARPLGSRLGSRKI